MIINFAKLRIGDRLVRDKGGFVTGHHALYAGIGLNNQLMVAENQLGRGVQLITLKQFLSEGKLQKIVYNNFNREKQQAIFQRIKIRMGKAYDFFMYNCEQFVNDVLYGKPKSLQVQTGAIIIFSLIGFLLLFLLF